eukprot:3511064-Pyramimonas_sp.AAC.1
MIPHRPSAPRIDEPRRRRSLFSRAHWLLSPGIRSRLRKHFRMPPRGPRAAPVRAPPAVESAL